MGALFAYILKSGICLALFYLFYRLLLSKETFHRFNRIALLGVLGFSVLLPSVKYTYTVKSSPELSVVDFPLDEELFVSIEHLPLVLEQQTFSPEEPATNSYYVCILLLIYLGGVCFFLFQTIWSFFKLFCLSRTGSPPIKEGNLKIYITEKSISPFSWMNRVVISAKDWEENGKEILSHEVGHSRCAHSWDLLFVQLCVVFHWFNPAAWLLKQELQNIHEFEADEYVLNKGVNIKQYQLLLIKKAVGTQRFTSMANSFNHSKLKKRITMMLKGKSSPWARLKYLYVLPVSLVVITGFARPEITSPLEKISAVKISEIFPEEKIQAEADSLLAKVDVQEYVTTITKQITVDSPEDLDISSIVDEIMNLTGDFEDIGVEFPDSVRVLKEEAVKIITENLPNGHANVVIEVSKQDTLPVSGGKKSSSEFWIRGISTFGADEKALILIDGEEGDFETLNVEDIDSFSVLKDASATAIYGEKGKNGVVLITTKKATGKESTLEKDVNRRISVVSGTTTVTKSVKENSDGEEKPEEFWIRGISAFGGKDKALVLVDGVERDFNEINVDDIKSFSVLKDASATAIYGEKGKNGVILVTTKKVQKEDADHPHFYIAHTKAKVRPKKDKGDTSFAESFSEFGVGENPLILVDGIEKDIESVNVEDMESLSILKAASATQIYGEKGKDGVVLITTKGAKEKEQNKPTSQINLLQPDMKELGERLLNNIESPSESSFNVRGTMTISSNHKLSKKEKKELQKETFADYWLRRHKALGFEEDTLIITDGEEGLPDGLVRGDIETFKLENASSATQLYGEKGKKGAVIITTKKAKGKNS